MFDGEMAPFKTRASLLLLVNCSQCITHSLRPLDAPVSHTSKTHQPRNETRCFQLGKYISMGPFARSLNILLLHQQPRSATKHQNIYQPILFNSPSLANLKPIIKKVYICYFGGLEVRSSKRANFWRALWFIRPGPKTLISVSAQFLSENIGT